MLDEAGVSHLIVTGAMTEHCIDKSALRIMSNCFTSVRMERPDAC
jgi:nicotinamidase-related amidase